MCLQIIAGTYSPAGAARREVGHSTLIERALAPVLPPVADFPFTVRLAADVLASNGSTALGGVCAGALALASAAVPLSALVAGARAPKPLSAVRACGSNGSGTDLVLLALGPVILR